MDPLSIAAAGSPGEAVVLRYNGPYHPPVQKTDQDKEDLLKKRQNEASKKQIMDSNGRVIDMASKADLYDNDKIEVSSDMQDFINQQAEYLWNKTDVNTDPEAYKKSKSEQQKILDKVSRAQQQKKAGDAMEKHIKTHPDLWPDGALDEVEKWKTLPSDKRGSMPPVKALGETDILSKLDVYNPGPTVNKWEDPIKDGRIAVHIQTSFDASKADKEADKVFMMQDDRRVKRLMEYALENVVSKAYPDWRTMPPQVVGKLVNDAAKKMLIEHWRSQTKESYGTTTKSAKDDIYGSSTQMGLSDALKAGIVKKDVPVNVAYQVDPYTDKYGNIVTSSTKNMSIPYIAAIPQNAKTKAVVPASVTMTSIKTGEPIKDPSAYLFIPGENAVYIKNGKVRNVVLGYIVDKRNFADLSELEAIKAQQTVTSDVEVPMEYIEGNLKAAGVQTEWTKDAVEDLQSRLKTYHLEKANAGASKVTKPSEPKTEKKSKTSKTPIGNLNF